MRWFDRYNWFAFGVAVCYAVFDGLGVIHPLFVLYMEIYVFPWAVCCIVFGVVMKLYTQLVVDKRPKKVYKEPDKP